MSAEFLPWVNMALNFLIVPALGMLHSISVTQASQTEKIVALYDRVKNLENKE